MHTHIPCLGDNYRLKTKLRKDNVFTSVCQEFCPQRVGVHTPRQTPPWADIPQGRNPPGADKCLGGHYSSRQTPPWADTPLGRQHHLSDGHCSGRYTSYWNAFLLLPAATKLGQGNIFTRVCDSVNRGGGV